MEPAAAKPRRARAGTLSREVIVAAAIDLVEAEGVEALSARRLAKRVGCEAMSLYNHFGSMEQLRSGIVDRLLGETLARADAAQPPAERVTRYAATYLDLAERYPHAFNLVATRLWKTERAVSAAAAMVAAFAAAGADQPRAWRNARVLGAYLNGAGLALAAWRRDSAVLTAGEVEAIAPVPAAARGADAVRADLIAGLDAIVARLLA